MEVDRIWLTVGLVGQTLFSARFFVQWLHSEKARKSVIPSMFWYLSISGGIILLAYAIHRRDPVFVIGQGLGMFVYLRNLQFVWRDRDRPGED